QAGLAGVGESDESDVRDHLELEDDRALLAGLSLEREPGSLAPRRGQGSIAETTPAASGRLDLGALANEVRQDGPVDVAHHGAVGDAQDEVLAARPVAVPATAVGSSARPPVWMAVEVDQRPHIRRGTKNDAPPVPTVAAVGPAEGLELLAMDRGDTVTAVTCEHVQR